MSMLQEFKAFAMRGNVMDMAVGIVIGGAFGKIVSSLVSDVIMPPIGMLTGGIDFSAMKWVLRPADDSDPKHKIAEVAINYGSFINTIITFVIVAFAIFMLIKAMNRLQKKKDEAPAAPPADVVLLTEIRDLLKNKP
ncbi:MAG: large-conductance mechanosensitive channel protein MscL [Xanthomonadaceae bacterium]|jgi:large conductance mechanosensitive channel|nr:large-conductance mechanosensitive channel protein MscL [Xanthomonadaceae bacterium]MDE2280838.1 large-conductance mechanosensitive channel protein MscL [Xanthomonadaceae bacterium]